MAGLSHPSDLYWWQAFLTPLNGSSFFFFFFFFCEATSPSAVVCFFSDASGSIGCGAIWGSTWLQIYWPSTVSSPGSELGSDSISSKEFLRLFGHARFVAAIGGMLQWLQWLTVITWLGAVAAVNSDRSRSRCICYVASFHSGSLRLLAFG